MTTYNTGNPVESADPLDLYDNAQDLDARLNSNSASTTNRLGDTVKTWVGIEAEAVGEAVAAAEAAIASIDIAKPYISSTQPASVELGNSPVETFNATKSESSNASYSSSCTDTSLGLVRTLYGITEFEPFHPADFPVDFTPNAPQLLIGSAYTTDPDYTERLYQGCASATKTGNRMWCGFRGDIQLYTEGSDIDIAEHTGNFVTLCKSDDDGVTWSEYGYIRYADGATYCCHEPVLWQAPDGKLWVFVTVSGNGTDTDGVYGVYVFVCKNPESSATILQWETPVKIFKYGFMNYQPTDVNGKMLVGVYMLRNMLDNYPVYQDKVGKHIYELDWKNKKAYQLSKLPDSIDAASFDEISITQMSNGITRAIWRTSNSSVSMETATSTDGGKTWSVASKYTSAVGDNASTRACVKTSPTGRTVLVYNNEAVNRRYLTVALSEDGGVTYPYKMVVEQPQPMSSSYPDVVFGGSGELYVFYDKGRSTPGLRKIVCTKMSETDIVNNVFSVRTTYVSDKGYVA